MSRSHIEKWILEHRNSLDHKFTDSLFSLSPNLHKNQGIQYRSIDKTMLIIEVRPLRIAGNNFHAVADDGARIEDLSLETILEKNRSNMPGHFDGIKPPQRESQDFTIYSTILYTSLSDK